MAEAGKTMKGELKNPQYNGVVFGAGTVREHLREVVQRVGGSRVFIVTTPSLTHTSLPGQLRDTLGPAVVGQFSDSRAHVPRQTVLRAAQAAGQSGPDILIALGGSSVIDLTKAIALVLAEGEDLNRHMARFSPSQGLGVPDLPNSKLPQVALPTTLSGGEYTGALGITDERRREKDLYVDPKLTPRWVFLDPEITIPTPRHLWANTGMKTLSDCLEALCSPRATPYTDALALGAFKLLYENLPLSVEHPEDGQARLRCQFAPCMVLSHLLNAGLGLVAGLRHQIGGGFGVGHGIASTIVLPHVLRWNLPYAVNPLAQAAAQVGLGGGSSEAAAHRLIAAIEEMTTGLGLPTRLRDVELPRNALRPIAEHVTRDFVVGTNSRPVDSAEDVMEVLEAAW